MTSALASEDLADLRADGLNPTDEDVIRLHALGCRLTDGAETTSASAPRWARVGGITFWEPTIAAWQWFEYARDFAANQAEEDFYFSFACAKGREIGYLSNLLDVGEIRKTIKAWMRGLAATKTELTTAIYYVTQGTDDIVPEMSEIAKKNEAKKSEQERERENYAVIETRLREAAASTGLSYDEILVQTPSRLLGMIYAANVQAGLEMTRKAAKAHIDYLATLKAIRERLEGERHNT